jgi:hypothetical protein
MPITMPAIPPSLPWQVDMTQSPLAGLPRARNYMPGVGLFLSRAGFTEQQAGEHPYGYAANNPVTGSDPSGLMPTNGQPCFTRPPECDGLYQRTPCDLGQLQLAEAQCKTANEHAVNCYTIQRPRGLIICFDCLATCDSFEKRKPPFVSSVNQALKSCTRRGETPRRSGSGSSKACSDGTHYDYRMAPSKRYVSVLCCPCSTGAGTSSQRCRCR